MNINLHIERLVLDGVALEPHQRPALKASLEAELGSLLGRNDAATGLQNSSAISTICTDSSINIGEITEPSHLGRQIATSVYGGLLQ